MSCPFVNPEIVRLELSGGDFVDVKRELNAGEHRRVFAGMVKDGIRPGEPTMLEPERVGMTRILAYIVAWSFTDLQGRPAPVTEAAIDNFTQDRFRELSDAIDAHVDREERRRAEEKKLTLTGGTGLRAIS